MKPLFASASLPFAETVNVQLQCISRFKKLHPWEFGLIIQLAK